MSGEHESMVLRRHDNGALEIVSEGTETQFISRDLLTEVVASLNERHAEIERLRAAGDALAEVALIAVIHCRDHEVEQCNRAYGAWQEARRER